MLKRYFLRDFAIWLFFSCYPWSGLIFCIQASYQQAYPHFMGSQEHFEGRNPCIAIRKHKLKLPVVVFPARGEHF